MQDGPVEDSQLGQLVLGIIIIRVTRRAKNGVALRSKHRQARRILGADGGCRRQQGGDRSKATPNVQNSGKGQPAGLG
jgi:hypothetical protein